MALSVQSVRRFSAFWEYMLALIAVSYYKSHGDEARSMMRNLLEFVDMRVGLGHREPILLEDQNISVDRLFDVADRFFDTPRAVDVEPLARGSEPAERFAYRDGAGEVGVIPSVTRAFCGTCDRIRLTADGQLRACLFATDEVDLRALLRSGQSDAGLADAVAACVRGKGPGHMIGQVQFVRPRRSMSQIGG